MDDTNSLQCLTGLVIEFGQSGAERLRVSARDGWSASLEAVIEVRPDDTALREICAAVARHALAELGARWPLTEAPRPHLFGPMETK